MAKKIVSSDLSNENTPPMEHADKVPIGHYTQLFLSSIWVIGAVVIVCIGLAFVITKRMTPTYQATTTIMVSKVNLGEASNYDTVWTGERLASTYADMITSINILDQVRPLVDSGISTGALKDAVSASPIVNTQLIQINVNYSDPAIAGKIANTLVKVFSSQIQKSQMELTSNQENASNAQLQATGNEIARLQEKLKTGSLQLYNQRLGTINKSISDIRNQIEKINQEMAPLQIKTTLTAAEQLTLSNDGSRKADLDALIAQYQNELAALTVRGPSVDSLDFESSQDAILLDQNQRLYASLLQDYQSLKLTTTENMVTVTQIDQPSLSSSPIRPNLIVNLFLGFAVGALLSVIYVFITNFDRTLFGKQKELAYPK